ncbi:MAG: hypothetical protein KME26_01820 [Oscillatoria princeps RMCB-10]|nr:hypothetical protein [Oscillatoria princeps RMCB-10]
MSSLWAAGAGLAKMFATQLRMLVSPPLPVAPARVAAVYHPLYQKVSILATPDSDFLP